MKIRNSFLLFMLTGLLFRASESIGVQVIEIDQIPPDLEYSVPAEPLHRGDPYEISVVATDNKKVARVTVYYRPGGEIEYRSGEMVSTDHDRYAYLIPGSDIRGERLEFYFIAEDEVGNRTMKGSSSAPLIRAIAAATKERSGETGSPVINLPASESRALGRNKGRASFEIKIGEGLYRLSDEGHAISVGALTYGINGRYFLSEGVDFDIGLSAAHSDSVQNPSIIYQNVTGTLYETLDLFTFSAGERFRVNPFSFLIGVSDTVARVSNRNLLDSGGSRLTRFGEENYQLPGLTAGMSWEFPITARLRGGLDPRITVTFSGQLDNLFIPAEVHYDF